MPRFRRLTLRERADISRSMALSHRRMAAEAIEVAERLEREADQMEAGIDPFKPQGEQR